MRILQISHAQAQGLVYRLSFGDLILLAPEHLNAYSSAIVRVARKHPDGIGAVKEMDILHAKIDFEKMERLEDKGLERSLLYSVVELLLQKEVAVREGEYIVLPSKFNRKLPQFPALPLCEVQYTFTGAFEEIYATLVVKLYYCVAFELKSLWKNAAEFKSINGLSCGFVLGSDVGSKSTLSIFFEKGSLIDTKILFLKFIQSHISTHTDPDSVIRNRIYHCPNCTEEVENKKAIKARIDNDEKDITCQFCNTAIPLADILEEKFGDKRILKSVKDLEMIIDKRKSYEVGKTTSSAKNSIGEFDVFLAHNNKDKPSVLELSELLKKRGINPWIDKEQIAPGRWFQDVIQQAIPIVKSAAIIIGKNGLGKWERLELRSFISQCVEKGIPIIPVLLPGIKEIPDDLIFLKEFNYILFLDNINDSDVLDDLQWGITGVNPKNAIEFPI